MVEALIPLFGALGGAVLGAVGGWLSTYVGPRKLEEWREQRHEERHNGPRKRLLLKMREDERWDDGRKLETLSRVTGTPDEECRRLLIEIGARGVQLEGNVEGWALVSRKPLDEQQQDSGPDVCIPLRGGAHRFPRSPANG